MDLAFNVEYDGQTYLTKKVGPADLVAFERKFGISASALAPDEDGTSTVRYEYMTYLIYRAMIRIEAIPQGTDFDAFLDKLEDFNSVDDEPEAGSPDPTVQEAPTT